MSEKKFKLGGILKIREYHEQIELYNFLQATAEDRMLAAKQDNLKRLKSQLLNNENNSSAEDFSMFKYVMDYSARCEEDILNLQQKRNVLIEQIEKAQATYKQAKNRAEPLRILKRKHEKNMSTEKSKHHSNDLQERMIWKK